MNVVNPFGIREGKHETLNDDRGIGYTTEPSLKGAHYLSSELDNCMFCTSKQAEVNPFTTARYV